jgi:hypothetical protein
MNAPANSVDYYRCTAKGAVVFLAIAMFLSVVLGETDTNTERLVEELGSADVSERQKAAAELLRLGPDALRALRANYSAQNAEIRNRSRILSREIQSNDLIKPTLVPLSYRQRSLVDIFSVIGPGLKLRVNYASEETHQAALKKLTVVESKPVTLWQAIDRLEVASGLRFDIGSGTEDGPDGAHFWHLWLSPQEPRRPRCNHGPFSILIMSISRSRSLILDSFSG